jgi:cytochrome b561
LPSGILILKERKLISSTSHSERYAKPMIVLHWLMLLLLIAVFACIESRALFEKGTEAREFVKNLHFMFGLSVFLLVIIRLGFKFSSPTPAIHPEPGFILKFLGKSVHIVLYILMIGMPIAGWLTLSAAGKPIPFFGLELPALIGENKALADEIETIHKTVGKAAYFLIGAHALAALFHHYIRRDNTLRRMLP